MLVQRPDLPVAILAVPVAFDPLLGAAHVERLRREPGQLGVPVAHAAPELVDLKEPHELQDGDAQRVHVGLARARVVPDDLGRHVPRRANVRLGRAKGKVDEEEAHNAQERVRTRVRVPRRDLLAQQLEEDVLGLDVAVHDAVLVEVPQRLQHLHREARHPRADAGAVLRVVRGGNVGRLDGEQRRKVVARVADAEELPVVEAVVGLVPAVDEFRTFNVDLPKKKKKDVSPRVHGYYMMIKDKGTDRHGVTNQSPRRGAWPVSSRRASPPRRPRRPAASVPPPS